jgi:predicted protein tyrosine phosphatase
MSEKMPETQRQFIAANPAQGSFKRVLCICTGGILRSPTAAMLLASPPYNFNTRAAGVKDFALIQVDANLIGWADEIVCMEDYHKVSIERIWRNAPSQFYPRTDLPPILVLNIPDTYDYRETSLITRIKNSYRKETQANGIPGAD